MEWNLDKKNLDKKYGAVAAPALRRLSTLLT